VFGAGIRVVEFGTYRQAIKLIIFTSPRCPSASVVHLIAQEEKITESSDFE